MYSIIIEVITAILLFPISVLFLQVFLAFFSKVRGKLIEPMPDCTMAILIPAHNESLGIANTLLSLQPHLKPGDRLIVIADNCSDDTAKVASHLNVEVIERFDSLKRGKGYALDFGVRYLEKNPPDIVIVIDADCIVAKGSVKGLASYAKKVNKPVQALYLMQTKPEAPLKSKIAEFAWKVKNQTRPMGFYLLSLPCPLMGSGMAFPWHQIANSNLASGNIVEDVKLGIDLSIAGHQPIFCPEVLVTSFFPTSNEAQASQRKRWEHGHLTTIFVETPRILGEAFKQVDFGLFALAFDLTVPPVSLLVMLMGVLFFIGTIAYSIGIISTFSIMMVMVTIVIFIVAILSAWWGWAKDIVPFSGFILAPVYVLKKIPHYLLYVFKRQTKWVRTDRD